MMNKTSLLKKFIKNCANGFLRYQFRTCFGKWATFDTFLVFVGICGAAYNILFLLLYPLFIISLLAFLTLVSKSDSLLLWYSQFLKRHSDPEVFEKYFGDLGESLGTALLKRREAEDE